MTPSRLFQTVLCVSGFVFPAAFAQGLSTVPTEPPARAEPWEVVSESPAPEVIGSGFESLQATPVMPESRNRFRDPVSGVTYSAVLYGPVNRSWNPFANYSLWRNVTVYRVVSHREEIADLPAIHQSCFDGGTYPMGNWQISRSISVELRSSLKCSELGLGGEISSSIAEGRTFSMQKALIAPRGIEADYTPVLRKDSWVGVTFIQTYEPSTRQLGYISPAFWESALASYPYDFELKNVATVFEVLRKNVRTCTDGRANPRTQPEPEIYLPLN